MLGSMRVFDGAQPGHTPDGAHVADTWNADACAILVSVLGAHATVRCSACDWPVWEPADTEEYPGASYGDLAGMIGNRMESHTREHLAPQRDSSRAAERPELETMRITQYGPES